MNGSIEPSKKIKLPTHYESPTIGEDSQLTVIFDSECEMCGQLANLLDRQQITTIPHQALSLDDPILSYNPRDRLVVIRNGSITTGFMAILEIAKAKYPRLKWILRRFGSGRLLILCDAAYVLVAKRRMIASHLIILVKTRFGSKPLNG